MDLILYGAGKRCSNLLELIKNTDIHIRAIIDSDSQKWGAFIKGYEVMPPDCLKLFSENELYFCITIADYDARTEIKNKYFDSVNMFREITYIEIIRRYYYDLAESGKLVKYVAVNEKKPVSVLFDCYNGLGLGGIEEWTKSLCSSLINQGILNIRILSKTGDYLIPRDLEEIVDYLNIDTQNIYRKDNFLTILKYFQEHMPCTIVTSQPSVVLMVASILKHYFPDMIRIISVIHGGTLGIYEQYMQYAGDVDEFVGVSEDIKRAMLDRGCPSVHAITCPVVCPECLEREYSENPKIPLQIGYAGRVEIVQKRMDLMLKVIQILEDKNINYHFNVAGDGSALHQVKEYISKNNMSEHVTFWGNISREKLPDFWKKQDICVNTADYEGHCISRMEAMVNGAVSVSTDTSGTREDVVDGMNGYFVPIGDYEMMAQRILYLNEHRNLLRSMGRKAYECICSKCSGDSHTLFWKELLRRQEWMLLQEL